MTATEIQARVPHLESEIEMAKGELRRAKMLDAEAAISGKKSNATAAARERLQVLRDRLDGLSLYARSVLVADLSKEIDEREHQHTRDGEQVTKLRAKHLALKQELPGGGGSAWRAAERDRSDASHKAFEDYESANNHYNTEANAISALIEKRDEMKAELDEALHQ